jgi:hypothetical protein
MIANLRRLSEDPLLWRVVTLMVGLPTFAIGIFGLVSLFPFNGWLWVASILLLAISVFGLYLAYASCFFDDQQFNRATAALADGGDVPVAVLLFALVLLAVPITLILRWIRPR